MLAPIEIHADPRDPQSATSLLVWEGFNGAPEDPSEEHCTTIVAVLSGRKDRPSIMDPDTILEWTCYTAAFNANQVPPEARREFVRNRGNKLPEEVARAMFPRLAEKRYRR